MNEVFEHKLWRETSSISNKTRFGFFQVRIKKGVTWAAEIIFIDNTDYSSDEMQSYAKSKNI